MRKTVMLVLLCMTLGACKSEDSSVVSDEDVASSAEDAVNAISATIDDSQGESYATLMDKSLNEKINELLFPRAYAAGCIRPMNQVCEDQHKISVFEDCTIFRGNVTLNGEIDLAFSTPSCTLDNEGDNVGRTFDYTLSGVRRGQMDVSSLAKEDYRGIAIGGGALLTKLDAGWQVDILGKHKVLSRNDNIRMDKSIRTLSPLEVTGGLRRNQRRVNNGQLEVNHNLAEFTATYTSQDLAWSSSCCHPVSGSLLVEYTGSKTGSGTITFESCGQATIERDGVAQDVEFSHCE